MASKANHSPLVEMVLAPPSQGFAVYLGTAAHAVVWATIVAVHVVCGAYNYAAAQFFVSTQNAMMTFRFELAGTILPSRYFPMLVKGHYAVCAIHCYFIISPVIWSAVRFVRRCKEPLRSSSLLSNRFSTGLVLATRIASGGASFVRFASVLPQPIERRLPQPLRRTVRLLITQVFGRLGLLGIESRHFDTVFFVREVLQTGFQTYQAYQMCRFLTRLSLNRVLVGMLVANCWITPTLHHSRTSEPLRRVLDRCFDVTLTLMASVGVTTALVWTYSAEFDQQSGDFPLDLWSDYIWSTRTFSEASIVFFRSWMDVACRFAAAIGLVLSLDDIKLLLKRKPARAVHPQGPSAKAVVAAKPNRRPSVLFGHRAMFLYGAIVLAVHLYSELRPRMPFCLMELRPWLTTQTFCSIIEFSCFKNRRFTGNAQKFDSVFARLDALTLVGANFRHCRSVEIQRSIQRFPNMTYISFYNSTILAWGEDAAITRTHTPKLTAMDFVRVNFTGGLLPDGIISRETPRLFMLRFSVTNIRALPDDLNERWPPRLFLVVDFSQLAEYPLAFTKMSTLGLVLSANLIPTVPKEAFEVPSLYYLTLSGNPVTLLPYDVDPDS